MGHKPIFLKKKKKRKVSFSRFSVNFYWIINNIRLVLLLQFLSPCGKELKQHTSYISNRKDVLGKQQAVHSVGLRVEQ